MPGGPGGDTPRPGLWLAPSPTPSTHPRMVKVEIRPGIWIRLTEEEARKRGIDVDAKPSNKAAKPQATKKPKAETPSAPVDTEPTPTPVEVVEAEDSE